MAIITEDNWESDTMTHDARTAYREAVAAVAAKARAKLPACAGRIDSAVKLVLAGDVELLADGGARVASRSDARVQYHTVNGHCDCKDFVRAPEGLCSHRLAYGIARRASELVPQAPPVEPWPDNDPESETPAQAPAPAPLPEMPFSVTLKGTIDGQDALLTARGMTAAEFQANLQAIRGLLDPVQAQAPAQGQPSQAPDATPQCPTHGAMKPSSKGKGWYCPHKNDDDTWCKSKGR